MATYDDDDIRSLRNAVDSAARKIMVSGKGANKAEAAYSHAWQLWRQAVMSRGGTHVMQIKERMR